MFCKDSNKIPFAKLIIPNILHKLELQTITKWQNVDFRK